MNDHLEQAAERAIELAESLTARTTEFPGDGTIAAHLAYLAGLLRGAATREPNKPTIGHEIRIDGRLDDAAVERFAHELKKLRAREHGDL